MRYALAILDRGFSAGSGSTSAQSGESKAATKAPVTRLPDGRPDLQGIWGFATLTPLQRPKEFADKETLTAEEKANLEERAVRDQFVDRPPPPGTTGSYNKSGMMEERRWWRPTAPR
jgi:hypothetical protein